MAPSLKSTQAVKKMGTTPASSCRRRRERRRIVVIDEHLDLIEPAGARVAHAAGGDGMEAPKIQFIAS